jgi:hypothetical protein
MIRRVGFETHRGASRLALTVLFCLQLFYLTPAQAQPRVGTASVGSPRDSAPIDLTGIWVSIVNEDWRWRMVTPPAGDYTSISMMNDAGRAEADRWDASQDGSCKAFGAAGLMRMPTRLRIGWDAETTLKLETDAGSQTRLFEFVGETSRSASTAAAELPSLQGQSTAEWILPTRRPGPPNPTAPPRIGGSLKVTTTNLLPGWLRRNGVPYSAQTTLTEYFDRFAAPNGDEWLVVTAVVEDPVYLTSRYVTSSHFRREADDAGWNPSTCRTER